MTNRRRFLQSVLAMLPLPWIRIDAAPKTGSVIGLAAFNDNLQPCQCGEGVAHLLDLNPEEVCRMMVFDGVSDEDSVAHHLAHMYGLVVSGNNPPNLKIEGAFDRHGAYHPARIASTARALP